MTSRKAASSGQFSTRTEHCTSGECAVADNAEIELQHDAVYLVQHSGKRATGQILVRTRRAPSGTNFVSYWTRSLNFDRSSYPSTS